MPKDSNIKVLPGGRLAGSPNGLANAKECLEPHGHRSICKVKVSCKVAKAGWTEDSFIGRGQDTSESVE